MTRFFRLTIVFNATDRDWNWPANHIIRFTIQFSKTMIAGVRGQALISSIKVEVKKKHSRIGRDFSCFAAHWMEQDRF
jgi:hypothetical protein